jgi:5-methylcytosine-specific restriction endonuclease McrA
MSTSDAELQESTDNTCPECGKEYKNQHGMRIHYAQVHDGRLATTTECDWCGDEFEIKPGNDRRFCSLECHGENRTENGLPARSRQVTLTCDYCGDKFSVPQSDADGKKYCSQSCYDGDSRGGTLECEWCGDSFKVAGEYVDEARFCSQDCYGEWMSNDMPLEDHPRYKGEDKLDGPQYGAGWNEDKREAVRERDNRECVACGLDERMHVEKYGRKLNVHHIVPAREFDDAERRNAMGNLISVCIPCHRRWEGIPLRPQ